MGLFSSVFRIGRAIGSKAKSISSVGKKMTSIGRGIKKFFISSKPAGVVKETIVESGTKAKNLTKPVKTQIQKIRELNAIKPVKKGIMEMAEEGGYYTGRGLDNVDNLKRLPYGKITERGLGGLTKAQRIAKEAQRIKNLV
tara:strand:+ start:51 stop:473 length:423 start_codon:yes stop_codon:yes gene_type:complete